MTDHLLTFPSDHHVKEEWQRSGHGKVGKAEGVEPEKTVILYDSDEIQSSAFDASSRARQYIDSCMDKAGLSSLLKTKELWKVIVDSQNRGTKFRFVTEITADTINDCKAISKIVELRHADNISGNFSIYDGMRYRASTSSSEGSPGALVDSTASTIVAQQQYFFDMLWNKAIPADQRITHLEQGITPEITEVLTGWENIFRRNIDDMSQAWQKIDSCCDAGVPPIIVGSPMYKASHDFVDRGGKIRMITEIESENLTAIMELMQFQEIRHISNFKINFGVSEKSFMAPTSVYATSTNPQCIYSNSKDLIREHQYLFETLWEKALPADQRISQIEKGIEPEITEIVTGWAGIHRKTVEGFATAKHKVDHCCDAMVLPRMAESPVHQTTFDFLKGGGRIRMITEITRENLLAVKEIMKTQEVRHINGFKVNFGVSDNLYSAPTSVYSMSSEPQCIYSNSKDLIREHQYLFETLWEKALPADQRISQIESGIEPEKIELIPNSRKSIALAFEIMKRTCSELLILFASPRTFMMGYGLGSIEEFGQMSKRGISVRLLVPRGSEIENEVSKIRDLHPSIDVRVSDADLNTNITILVSDRKEFINWQLRDDTLADPYEAGGIATYSTMQSLASSYATIFDNLWKITEIAESLKAANIKLKNSETSMKEFIDIAAHELRTPVQPIIGLAEVLRGKTKNHEWSDLIDAILRNANRLKRLQQNILDVTKIENQLIRYDREIFHIDEMILQLVRDEEQSSPDSERPKILMDLHSNTQVDADRQRIAQVILNLLGNSMEFTKGSVEISSRVQNGEVVIEVNDTGTGIDPEIMPKLFSKFSTRSSTGTGLGLFISKSIVEAHSGRIWAKNKESGTGAIFSFSLPIVSSVVM